MNNRLYTKVAKHFLANPASAMTVTPSEAAAARYLADPTDAAAREVLRPTVERVARMAMAAKAAAS